MELGASGERNPFTINVSNRFKKPLILVSSVASQPSLSIFEDGACSGPGSIYYPGKYWGDEGFSTWKERVMHKPLFESKPVKYDVCISSAEDTQFTGYLEKYLAEKGFSICKDNLEATKNYRIFIPVLSNGYASSTCLDDLAEIIEIAKANRRRILPVFYQVSPSDVRHQLGSYGEVSAANENRINALKKVADIIGWHIERGRNKIEHEYIEEILQEVSKHVACTVGLDTRVQEVVHCLDSKSEGVCVVAICGDSGIGKSTLAREVYHYNPCNKCVYRSFVDKAGEYSSKHALECLLSKIVGENNIESAYVKQKKVFSVLEDIDDLEQLNAIVELTKSLASGSKVIITAQDYHLLKMSGIDKIYEMKKFNNAEAYEFLCLKMFQSRHVKANSVSIIKRAATYGSGLPFTLEVIGATLAGKEKKECEFILDKFEMIPNGETQEILKVCFNALEELPQQMLIHIAHHLKEKELKVVEDKLHISFGSCPRKDMKVLLDKSFIKINEHGQVTLHDLILDIVKDKC